MGSMQIVFLFDLNACNNILFKSRQELNKKLRHMRLACLRLLTDFSTKTTNLRWGCKFFDSCGSITQTMCKFSFTNVSLEAFETLENEICIRYERHLSYSEALAESSHDSENITNTSTLNSKHEKHTIAQVKLLQLAINQILSEFQWENIDMWSPSSNKIKNRTLYMGKRNFLFLFSDFKDDNTLFKYFELDNMPSKSKFANIILPRTLQDQLLNKADIHWIWINTCLEQKFLDISSTGLLPLLSDTLQFIHGSLIPLSLLSQPLYHMKSSTCAEISSFQNETLLSSNVCDSFLNSLLPFSSLFLQSLHQPFYSNVNTFNDKCTLNFTHNSLQIPVQVIAILNRKEKRTGNNGKTKITSSVKDKCVDAMKVAWTKFTVQGAVSKNIHYTAYDALLCFSSFVESKAATSGNLVMLNESLYLEELSLVLECVTDSGVQMPGLLIPLSHDTALITILDPTVYLLHRTDFKMLDNSFMENSFETSVNNVHEIQNLKAKLNNQNYCDNETITHSKDSTLKHFQMECMESWFKPTSASSSLVSFIQSEPSDSSKLDAFHKMLQYSIKGGEKLRGNSSKELVLQASEAQPMSVCQTEEVDEIFADLNEEELVSTAKDIYNSALETSSVVIDSAKKIVKMVSHYFKKQRSLSFEENVQNFMKNNFLMTIRRISEKYEVQHSQEDVNKYIKECQMQVYLALEIEALLLPPDRTNCINAVTSFLRMMSFYSGASNLNKFLTETLQANYSYNLYDVLVEIGEELDIPVFNETEFADSPDILSSELADGELDFVLSSNISERSSSSNCSRKDRKLVRRRSDISDTTTKSRQILLPGTSPKRRKGKYAQKKAIRCSPRLASKKNDGPSKSAGNPRNVRRNLFPKDKTNQTPKKNKYRSTTPRSHKPNRVVETPSHKQSRSTYQRRKSFIELTDEIAESPKNRKNAKKNRVVETPSHKQSRSTMQGRKSFIGLTDEITESPKNRKNAKNGSNKTLPQKLPLIKETLSQPSFLKREFASFQYIPQCTPDRIRRRSLQLFTKLLSSPTARLGVKRCTKRLFDQVSPQKYDESCKKQKSEEANPAPTSDK